MPKAWCRDPDRQFAFKVQEEQCHATYAVAAHAIAVNESRDEAIRAAVQMWAGFFDGKEPDVEAGLGIISESDAS